MGFPCRIVRIPDAYNNNRMITLRTNWVETSRDTGKFQSNIHVIYFVCLPIVWFIGANVVYQGGNMSRQIKEALAQNLDYYHRNVILTVGGPFIPEPFFLDLYFFHCTNKFNSFWLIILKGPYFLLTRTLLFCVKKLPFVVRFWLHTFSRKKRHLIHSMYLGCR